MLPAADMTSKPAPTRQPRLRRRVAERPTAFILPGIDVRRVVAWLLLATFLGACLPQTGAVAALGGHHGARADTPHTAHEHTAHEHGSTSDAHASAIADGHGAHAASDHGTAKPDHAHGHCLLCFVHTTPAAQMPALPAPPAAGALRVADVATTTAPTWPAWPRFLARAPPRAV